MTFLKFKTEEEYHNWLKQLYINDAGLEYRLGSVEDFERFYGVRFWNDLEENDGETKLEWFEVVNKDLQPKSYPCIVPECVFDYWQYGSQTATMLTSFDTIDFIYQSDFND